MIIIKMVQTFVLYTCVMIGIKQFIQFSPMTQYTIYYITKHLFGHLEPLWKHQQQKRLDEVA